MDYLIEITIAITLPIGVVIGYFFRQFIEDKIIRRRDRDNRYALAYNTFSKSFTLALHLLEDIKQPIEFIISDEFQGHERAMLDFVHMLKGTKSEDRFKETWTEYENKCQRIKKYCQGRTSVDKFTDLFESDGITVIDFNKELNRLIHELLEIAKP